MEPIFEKQKRDMRFLKVYGAVITILLLILFIKVFGLSDNRKNVLRVRGLIIEDASGRERILIGAPVPRAENRVRTDMDKVRQAWGKRFPNFGWYEKLDHTTNGILILDENGFDRIAIGDPTPDPNIGKRISPAVGIHINDKEGFERTGWGYFPEKDRVVLGLDTRKGSEGVVLFILEDNSLGLSIIDDSKNVFLGSMPSSGALGNSSKPFFGLLIRDKGEIKKKIGE